MGEAEARSVRAGAERDHHEPRNQATEADLQDYFSRAFRYWLQFVAIVPLDCAAMTLSWAKAGTIPSAQWTCGFCGVLTGNDKGWQGSDGALHSAKTQAIRICANCGAPSYFDDYGRVHPAASQGREIEHLPPDVHQLHAEARRSISVHAFTAAVMVCRKILSHVAVERGAKENSTFKHYVEFLGSNGYIPPNGQGWVAYIKDRGNDANHEIELMKLEDATNLLRFTEALLRNVYELPAMVPA